MARTSGDRASASFSTSAASRSMNPFYRQSLGAWFAITGRGAYLVLAAAGYAARRCAAEVLKDPLPLSPEVRAMLIDSLIGSLDQAVDAAAEETWREEIHRRLQEIDSGDRKSVV